MSYGIYIQPSGIVIENGSMSVVEIIGPNLLVGIGILGSFVFMVYFVLYGEWNPSESKDRATWFRASVAMVIISWTMFFVYVFVNLIS